MNLKEQASEAMKQKIMATAITILGTEGYPALTANKLVQTAGISKGILYHHFKSLEELRLAVLKELVWQYMSTIDVVGHYGLEEYFDQIGEQLFRLLDTQPVMMKALYGFFSQAMFNPRAKHELQQMIEKGQEEYLAAVHQLRPELSGETLKTLMSMVDMQTAGITLYWFIQEDRDSCRNSWKRFCRLLLADIDSDSA